MGIIGKRIGLAACLCLLACRVAGQELHGTEELFRQGKAFFGMGNYTGASDKLEAFKRLTADGESASGNAFMVQEADFMLACAAFEQGLPEADERLTAFAKAYPDTQYKDALHFMLASVCFNLEAYGAALHHFRQVDVDRLDVAQQEACTFRLAYSLLQEGRVEEAGKRFAVVGKLGTVYKEAANYYAAYVDYVAGRNNKALAGFQRLQQSPAYGRQSLFYIMQIDFTQGRYLQVIRQGIHLLASYPKDKNNSEVHRLLGNAYHYTEQNTHAIRHFTRYIEAVSTPLRGDLYTFGICLFEEKAYAEAVTTLGRILSENDALSQSAYFYLGLIYLQMQDSSNAIMAFEAAATTRFDNKVRELACYNYALLVHETHFTGLGGEVRLFEDFLNDFPHSSYASRVNEYLVEIYMTTRDYPAALASIEKIRNPNRLVLNAKQHLLFHLGVQAFTNNSPDEAIQFFTRTINQKADKSNLRNEAYFWRGEIYYSRAQYNNAATDYHTCLTGYNTPDSFQALASYSLAYCYFKQQHFDRALTLFHQFLDYGEKEDMARYADALSRIGDCLFYNRRFADATEYYTNAALHHPPTGDYPLFQKAFLLGLQKDYTGKIREMDRLITSYPRSSYMEDALYEKAHAYLMQENNTQAAKTFNDLRSRFPNSALACKAGLQTALIYFNENRPQEAIDAYKDVIHRYPGTDESRVALQDLKTLYVEQNDIPAYTAYLLSLGGNAPAMDFTEEDSLTYFAAERLYIRGEKVKAQEGLTAYLQHFPQGAFRTDADYYLALFAFDKGQYNEAKQGFEHVLTSGNTKFMEEALTHKAEIAYREKNYAEALETYRLLLSVAGQSSRKIALTGIIHCALASGNLPEALPEATELLLDSKLSPDLQTEARYVQAKAFLLTERQAEALLVLQTLSQDIRTPYGAEAKYLLAQLYYDTGDDDAAIQVLQDYARGGTPHRYWLARGFILWADICIRRGEDAQARTYLNNLQRNYEEDDDIAGMITNRLEKLKQ